MRVTKYMKKRQVCFLFTMAETKYLHIRHFPPDMRFTSGPQHISYITSMPAINTAAMMLAVKALPARSRINMSCTFAKLQRRTSLL